MWFFIPFVMKEKSVLDRLFLVGVSHVSKESIKLVSRVFKEKNPEIIAIELDEKRFSVILQRIMNKKTKRARTKIPSITKVGIKGFLFGTIASFIQRRIGKNLGVSPGSEMEEAIKLALKHNRRIVLVDKDIDLTLREVSKNFGFKEKINFIVDILKAPFKREQINFDIRKIPDRKVVDEILSRIKSRYPGLYKVLVTDRNRFIAKKLFRVLVDNPNSKVMAVLGVGHEEAVLKFIRDFEKKLSKNQIDFSYSYRVV